jgi:hypothetical protein
MQKYMCVCILEYKSEIFKFESHVSANAERIFFTMLEQYEMFQFRFRFNSLAHSIFEVVSL